MGKRKNKNKNLVVEPFVDDYTQAEDAREQRLLDLSSVEVEPEPEAQPDSFQATTSAGEPEHVVPKTSVTERPWKEVDDYLGVTASGGKGQQLLVRGEGDHSSAGYVQWDSRITTAPAATSQLKTLEITATPLCTLPSHALGPMAELRELRLPNNALLDLPDMLFSAGAGLPQLQVIDISSNRLRSLPSSIVRLPNLQVLNVSSNEIVELPDLSCLAAFKTLNVTQNAISALPMQLPTSISVLLAANNQLAKLPSLAGCMALSELDVRANVLTALPPTLADCAKLKSLRCSGQAGGWADRKLGKLLQQEGKLKPILNHLRGGSRAAARKQAVAAADAIPPQRLWTDKSAADTQTRLKACISVEAVAVRPHACICVLHLVAGTQFTPSSLKAFVDAQTAIHDTIGRRREACSIGTHDMRHVVLSRSASEDVIAPLVIDALPPEEVKLIPLLKAVVPAGGVESEAVVAAPTMCSASEVIAAALATVSRDGASTGARKYAGMLVDLPRVPVFLDATGTVLSLPPLTNALQTKVELTTTSILVECSSAQNLDVCREAALELVAQTIAIFERQQKQTDLYEQGQEPESPMKLVAQAEGKINGVDACTEDLATGSPTSLNLKVLVEQVSLHNAWGQGYLRSRFPSWEELRRFEREDL